MTSKPSTPDSDGPKTETTLTTRIRINIPGSRPIPPVVVRKPVKDAEGAAQSRPEVSEGEAGQAAVPAPAPSAGPGAGAQASPAPLPTRNPAASQAGRAQAQGGSDETSSNWFAPRKSSPTPPAGVRTEPGPAQGGAGYGPTAGGAPAGQGGPVGSGPAGSPAPDAARTGGGVPRPQGPASGYGSDRGFPPGPPAPGSPQGYPEFDNGPSTEAFPAYEEPARQAGPAGPTTGPAFGTAPVRADDAPRWPGPEAPPAGGPFPGGPRADGPVPGDPFAGDPFPGGPVPGDAFPGGPVPGDTFPGGPVPGGPGPLPGGPLAGGPGPGPVVPTAAPQPPKQTRPAPKAPAKPAKKRSKLVMAGGGLIVLLGVAYGAGLLLNHSDVPKGTTVLGVDISGSRDEAVTRLQAVFGTRASAPLQFTVGGKQVELKPDKAGLTLDTQTTVRNATGSDYNPVTVIGSLLGQSRTAEAVMPVDEEKLRVALQQLAGSAGTATEGTIKFDTGKAVAVPGQAGTSLDVDGSVDPVIKAFRNTIATGKSTPVELPTATREPSIDQAELNRAMKEFAEPAMSGIATVKAGSKSIAFGAKTLPKILSMTPVQGHLVEKYDLEALKAAYSDTFDGVQIARGTGAKTAVTPQDVAGALGKALRGKTPAERTAVIDTDAN
ncbi:hypothetical protein GCM10010347_15770 [Streptomyces cirratus]|uniref:Peptidoglycan binding domain-containing protein n=1 Tax=Streptomyces cirratus TaxID=68187 RepID=A0ABQ3EPU7_9ACTN|nr:hypothetical protein [Streptomyces cirratus]GHB46931.1 hypothetical protein GCM10010347_15770 [Streptomyces cirratus]